VTGLEPASRPAPNGLGFQLPPHGVICLDVKSRKLFLIFGNMKELYTSTEFALAKSNDKLKLQCYYCQKPFFRKKKYILFEKKHNKRECRFCNQKCLNKNKIKKLQFNCTNCGKEIEKRIKERYKPKSNFFCSQSCAATYNNKNKQYGTRRSKLEIWLENKLKLAYPSLEIYFNKKEIINSELDIYIPSLNLAFELNGIFHYKPIYGEKKFQQIQNNDNLKKTECCKLNINLQIIDTSKLQYFKEQNCQKYLDLIQNIIDSRQGFVASVGFEPRLTVPDGVCSTITTHSHFKI